MLTLALLSQKGGAGKTTLATAIAVSAERASTPSVLVDLDPQGSATKWSELREADTPVVSPAEPDRLIPVLDAARHAGAKLAVIDTAPHATRDALEAARAAHLVVVPCRPAVADVTAIGTTIDLARQANRSALVVLNAAPVRNPITDQARDAIAGYGAQCAPTVVHQRIDHVHAWTAGLTAEEHVPRSKAAAELAALFAWLRTEGGLRLG